MSPPATRTGIVVLTIERDEAAADRLLIRVRTTEDALANTRDLSRSFTAWEPAAEYVRAWLEEWTDGG